MKMRASLISLLFTSALFGALLQSSASSAKADSQPEKPALSTPTKAKQFLGFRPQMRPMSFDLAKQLNLKPLRSGGYLYRGTKKERFDARIFPDGSVEFRDAGKFEFKTDVLCFGVVCPKATPKRRVFEKAKTKKEIDTARRRKKARKIATGVALWLLTGALPVAGLDGSQPNGPWSGVNAGLGRPGSAAMGVFYAGGRFGRPGQLSIHKEEFLARTRAFRLEMAVVAQEAYMRRALSELSNELLVIEKNTNMPPKERRDRLLRLWERFDVGYEEAKLRDEILNRVNNSMGSKLSFARKQILAFARRVFPKGSPQAFSDKELAQANEANLGGPGFNPYR